MAALTNPVIQAAGGGGGQSRWAVLSFQKVTAGDTFDVSTLSQPFTTAITGLAVATTRQSETFAVATVASTTIVTVVGTGILNDALLLFVWGT